MDRDTLHYILIKLGVASLTRNHSKMIYIFQTSKSILHDIQRRRQWPDVHNFFPKTN